MRRAVGELFLDVGAIHGEGPAWDAAAGSLLWVDIHGRRVHRTSSAGGDTSVEYGQRPSAVAPRRNGGLALALSDGFWLEEPAGVARPIFRLPDPRVAHANDAKCDPRGRFWFGSMAADGVAPAGALYRAEPDGQVATMLSGVTISNGLAWTLDERTMYYVDTPTGRVDAFDFEAETGRISNRRPTILVPAGSGQPDGMTVDDEGCLWVALWGGGAVHRYTPDGRLDTILSLPVSQVTSCTFGGSEGRDLYVTTSTLGVPTTAQANGQGAGPAGAVYHWRPGVSGPAATAFAG